MSEKKESGSKRRVIALGAAAVLAWLVLIASDDGSLKTLAVCVTTGQLSREVVDGRPFEVDYFGMKYFGTLDNWVDTAVYFWGAHEKANLLAMQDVLKATNPGGDGVSVDIGANVGTHTMHLATHSAKVHAIEPWPTVLERLGRHVEVNGLDNVVIYPVGVAAEAGTMPFHVPPGTNLGWGSFSDSFAKEYDDKGARVIDLPLVVGDAYFAEKGIGHVDLIKIDIEGYEKPALQGFAGVLKRDRPAVFLELNTRNEEGFHDEQDLRATFPDGYEFYEITEQSRLSWQYEPGHYVVCHNDEGRYVVDDFDFVFTGDTRTLLAVPPGVREKLGH